MSAPDIVPNFFETERLIVRRSEAGDGPLVSEAILESWDSLYKYAPWALDPANHTPEKEEACSLPFQQKYNDRTDFFMQAIEKKTGRFLGRIELYAADWTTRTLTLGYWFRKSAEGQRFASEAAAGIVDFGFHFLKANRLIATWKSDNEPSGRILKRLGFTETAIKRGLTDPKTGSQYDEHHCSLTR